MAEPVTQSYEQMVLEVDFADTQPDPVWSRICGIQSVTITRRANTVTTEVPDCDDEALPNATHRRVTSIEVSVSGEGVWAQSANGKLAAWFYAGAAIPVRIGNLNAAVGDVEYETGRAVLTSFPNSRPADKGLVRASLELQFDGTPAQELKA